MDLDGVLRSILDHVQSNSQRGQLVHGLGLEPEAGDVEARPVGGDPSAPLEDELEQVLAVAPHLGREVAEEFVEAHSVSLVSVEMA